ncbi:TonB-dependent receptor [uncultured Phascolarctobacterium sp.]|jgi:vitamin B12 transporter|uniref:TonB-dependent receptor n=1 Tax=uncultured Phascolarctobacterium sp. TaxID=512296 RepID=UPI0025F01078|nr:TonB-dependent receptor [uncultured Phascolarctobacterium sp.]
MRKCTKISLAAVLATANLGFAVPAFAEELATYNLDTMVVTAQRESKRDVDTPASVTALSQQQLVETGASNLFDALRMQSGVTTYSYGGSQSFGGRNAKVLMRGASNGTVVMIDGMPANINETYYLDTIPVESIERVEIVKGAASTLYGSEASTGVINIITKKKMANTLSLTKGEYGKAKEALTLNADKLNLAVALEQSDPLKGYNDTYRQINDLNKKSFTASYRFDDNWSFSHQHNDSKFSYDKFDKSWSKLTEDAKYHYIDDFSRLQYKDGSVSANLFYNRSNRRNQTYSVKDSKFTKLDHLRFDTIGLDLQKQIESKFADIIVGTTISRDSYKNDISVAKNITPGTQINEFRTNYAVFAQLSKDLGDGYTATVGARETIVEANKKYDAFTPQFSLLKKLDENSSLYANAAKSFKMPSFTQIYGGGSANFAANPFLEPEEGWTYEFGYKKSSSTSMFKAALYYMDLDTIEYEGDGSLAKPYYTRNMSFINKGVEVTYDKDFGSKYSYSLGANYCNPMGKNKAGAWERKFAREQYNASIKYHDDRFNAALTGMFMTDRASNWGDLLPVNFIASYKLDKSSTVELGVENIFDRDDLVSNPGSATKYYCLPRMVHVTYTYKF